MDWGIVEGLLQCEPGNVLRTVMAMVGAAAGSVTIVGGIYAFWRWWFGPSGRHKRAARALRIQGHYRAKLKHRRPAMELYDLSIKLNPRPGHVYFLRGCLHEEMGQINRAIADWKRCVHRLPEHRQALRKLGAAGIASRSHNQFVPRWAYLFCAGAAVIAVAVLTALTQ